MSPERSYLLISPCRDEAEYMRRTLDSVSAQTSPAGALGRRRRRLDGRDTGHPRGVRAGRCPTSASSAGRTAAGAPSARASSRRSTPGSTPVDLEEFDYVCKLDLDLDLAAALLRDAHGADGGEPAARHHLRESPTSHRATGRRLVPEVCGDEMSVGMTKFYRIGVLPRDRRLRPRRSCGTASTAIAAACSAGSRRASTSEALRFIHLRPMGSSQKGIWTGRVRIGLRPVLHGHVPALPAGQRSVPRAALPLPRRQPGDGVGLSLERGAWRRRYDDPEFRRFLRRYQQECLLYGKGVATRRLNEAQAARWHAAHDRGDGPGQSRGR